MDESQRAYEELHDVELVSKFPLGRVGPELKVRDKVDPAVRLVRLRPSA